MSTTTTAAAARPRHGSFMYDPVSPRRTGEDDGMAKRLPQLTGRRVGLLHNGKPGGEHILAGIRERIGSEHPGVEFDFRFKAHASAGAPFLDELVGYWDAAVIAVGDCGSCSSWAVRDGVELEKRGIPSVVFVSDPFGTMSRLFAEQLDMPNLAIIAVPHPLAHLPAEVLCAEFGAPAAGRVAGYLVEAGDRD